MRLEKFFENVAPFYQALLEDERLNDQARDYLKSCFVDFYISTATEDDIKNIIKEALEETFTDMNIEGKLRKYLEYHDVSTETEVLNTVIKLLLGGRK